MAFKEKILLNEFDVDSIRKNGFVDYGKFVVYDRKRMKETKQVKALKDKLRKAKANLEVYKFTNKQLEMDRNDWRKKFIKLQRGGKNK